MKEKNVGMFVLSVCLKRFAAAAGVVLLTASLLALPIIMAFV